MPKSSALVVADHAPALVAQWAKARRYVEAATLFQRASLAAQIMAGFELDALRKIYAQPGKRTDLTSSHNGKRLTFEDALNHELKLSVTTAYRWMEMAKAARPRLAKSDLQLGSILEKHPGALTSAEQELLKAAVHKISDGKTQLEFLLESKAIKAPQGSGAKGGNTATQSDAGDGDAGDTPPPPPKPDNVGWHEIAKLLNNLLVEHLDPANHYWNQCSEARRRELHGNLVDAATAVAATLKKEKSA